jgi:hypothetical protein
MFYRLCPSLFLVWVYSYMHYFRTWIVIHSFCLSLFSFQCSLLRLHSQHYYIMVHIELLFFESFAITYWSYSQIQGYRLWLMPAMDFLQYYGFSTCNFREFAFATFGIFMVLSIISWKVLYALVAEVVFIGVNETFISLFQLTLKRTIFIIQ